MAFSTYILYSRSLDRYYIGHTGDSMAERLRRHHSSHKGFTGRADDWELRYSEEYPDKQLASRREREIKAWKSGKMIESWFRASRYSREGKRSTTGAIS